MVSSEYLGVLREKIKADATNVLFLASVGIYTLDGRIVSKTVSGDRLLVKCSVTNDRDVTVTMVKATLMDDEDNVIHEETMSAGILPHQTLYFTFAIQPEDEQEGSGYSILETASYKSSTLTVTLPAQPKLVIVTLRGGSIAANGMFAYASYDSDRGEYVSYIQTRASGSAVAWSDVSRYAVWDEEEKTFSMRVRTGTSAAATCTYHAVG